VGKRGPKPKIKGARKRRFNKHQPVDFSQEDGARWTEKMELFCQEYAVDFNASRAARAAGYSEKTAGAIGSDNLTKPGIQKRIHEVLEERAAASAVTKERIVQELARIAFSDLSQICTFEDGKMVIKDTSKLDKDQRLALAQMTQKTGNTSEKSIKLHDKAKALELLARHLNLFKDGEDGKFTGVVFVTPGEDRV